ncbi:uncharacterized protein EDB91DRAFT_1234870 [Suillus paluster]|uniref:uncharacterized protein n=1 Tax=Suillus paluster TaxID=48578 RepID=UPI001B8823F1|nr:uncharacterized protein EDB91DRAFT_1234870 [Suillus paluster]KAG1751533.1 hypothetical protein EDB91DRAFT_1234870 [Suillus paluster]
MQTWQTKQIRLVQPVHPEGYFNTIPDVTAVAWYCLLYQNTLTIQYVRTTRVVSPWHLAAVSTIQPSRPDCNSVVPSTLPPNLHVNIFQRSLAISDLDFKDNRYPTLTLDKSFHKTSPMIIGSADTQAWGPTERQHTSSRSEVMTQEPQDKAHPNAVDQHGLQSNGISSSLPQGAARVVERYSLDNNAQASGNGALMDSHLFNDSFKSVGESLTISPSPPPQPLRELPASLKPAGNRQPSYPSLDAAGSSRLPHANGLSTSRPYSPAMGITIPISPNPRAYAQHPTYITPAAAPDPINPILSPNPPVPPEEICVECAMRDQDMADVVVVGSGIWDRESDVLYEDLLRREQEDEAAGVLSSECSSKPRARGGRLTEQNLKIWHTMTPREPASRQQTLEQYVRTQRSLLEAEALAHARAMQESMQLEHKMRDTYSQFRRSAYDLNGGADDAAFRLKPPHSSYCPSRDITVLENGLIVEHVDIRKEEKEEERRRRNERQGLQWTFMSIYSVHSLAPHTDSGLGPMQSSRYSAISSIRPISSLTAPTDRQPSLGQDPASPRRSRFFGFKNLISPASGMSGSMIDMHVALHHEGNGLRVRSPVGDRSMLSTPRHSQLWPPIDPQEPPAITIWKLVRGSTDKDDPQNHASSRDSARSQDTERNEDDLPLAPPPPLSYLVDRGQGEHSTPSLPSTSSPRNQFSSSGMSPSTAPSSLLPSPTSSRPSGMDRDPERKSSAQIDEKECYVMVADESGRPKLLHPVISEPDIRLKLQQTTFASTNGMTLPRSAKSQVLLSREKSLPPLPGEVKLRPNNPAAESRPQTLYTYDPRQVGQESNDSQFSGSTSRPHLGIQTMPYDHSKGPGGMYNEFGISRRSLGRLEHIDENPQPSTPSKRRSKFGFASLLGRKSTQPEPANGSNSHEFPRLTTSLFEGEDSLATSYTSTSRQSAGPRMSVTSRKALEERVDQDREFIAYRYPSNDQRLDILR